MMVIYRKSGKDTAAAAAAATAERGVRESVDKRVCVHWGGTVRNEESSHAADSCQREIKTRYHLEGCLSNVS